jgi:hypothetical protein
MKISEAVCQFATGTGQARDPQETQFGGMSLLRT